MNLKFPHFSLDCIRKIEENGFSAWFVGGCVRDALLDRPFTDIDIATNATPDDIIRIFDKTIPTGIKHGTVTVIVDSNAIEVTTFRSEDGYKDSRHPDFVEFKKDINEDLSRRDFTVNALAYNPSFGLLDIYNGVNDLENGIIRCVGDPNARFREDALRILRAYRFASILGFRIEKKTEDAAISLIDNIKFLSGERIFKELKKLACGDNLSPFEDLIANGALEFCGIKKNSAKISIITNISSFPEFRLSALLNLCGFDAVLLKKALKIDNLTLNYTIKLSEILKEEIPKTKIEAKLLLSKYDTNIFKLYIEYLSLNNDTLLKDLFEEIIKNKEPYKLSDLNIDGNDIKSLGFKDSEIGKQMQYLLNKVIENPEINKKERLISLIKI